MTDGSQQFVLVRDLRPNMKHVFVQVIVLEIGKATVTKDGKTVRSVKVGDRTACIDLTLWDEYAESVRVSDILRLNNGYVSFFRNSMTLNVGKMGVLLKIGEFCMVFNEQLNMSDPAIPEVKRIYDTFYNHQPHNADDSAPSSLVRPPPVRPNPAAFPAKSNFANSGWTLNQNKDA